MRIQVENARKEEGKHFSFSFVQPASKLGDIDDMPWKDNDISVEGEYWFDGSHLIVEGVIHTRGIYECASCLAPVEAERVMQVQNLVCRLRLVISYGSGPT